MSNAPYPPPAPNQPYPYGYPPMQPMSRQRPPDPNPMARQIASGLIAALGLVMVVVFFVVSWVSLDPDRVADTYNNALDNADAYVEAYADDADYSTSEARRELRLSSDDFEEDDQVCESFSAWQIWIGSECNEDGDAAFDSAVMTLDPDGDDLKGFGDVGLPERMLILYPLFGLGLVGVAVIYFTRRMNDQTVLVIMVVLALGAFLLPIVWSTARNMTWRSEIEDDDKSDDYSVADEYGDDAAEDYYDVLASIYAALLRTTTPTLIGFVSVVVAGGAYAESRNNLLSKLVARGRGMMQQPPNQMQAPYGQYPQQPPQAGWGQPPSAPPPAGWGQQPPPGQYLPQTPPQAGWGQQSPPNTGGSPWGAPPQPPPAGEPTDEEKPML